MRRIDYVVVHHSASKRSTTFEEVREWHLAKGWKDIGYHFFIDGKAKLHYGRPIDQIGAHAKGHNSNSIGICIAGDNTKDRSSWTADQIDILKGLIAALRTVLKDNFKVVGHRELVATLCPGLDIATLGLEE